MSSSERRKEKLMKEYATLSYLPGIRKERLKEIKLELKELEKGTHPQCAFDRMMGFG